MTPSEIAALLAEVEADAKDGTCGPLHIGSNNPSRVYDMNGIPVPMRDPGYNDELRAEADARRFARVPALEAALRAQAERITALEAVALNADYDAGLLASGGGGDVNWWQDYLRAEIGRANDYWRCALENAYA